MGSIQNQNVVLFLMQVQLDHAFEQIAATKDYFERKRSNADQVAGDAGEGPAAKTEAGG